MFDWHKHRSALWNGMKLCRVDLKLLRVRMHWNVTYDICRVEWITVVFHYTFCCLANFPDTGDVWFSLRGITYQNNSCVILEDIGESDDALLCRTNFTGLNRTVLRNWFFPNGTKVPGLGNGMDFYRTRSKDQMVVRLNRRRGGEEGIYRCEISDSTDVIQTIYIGVYSAGSGEWCCMYICSWSVPVRLAVPMLQNSVIHE